MARIQTWIGLSILGAVLLTTSTLAVLSREHALTARMERQDFDFLWQTRGQIFHPGDFQNPEERWLYSELPRIDFSKGGVYLIGSSSLVYAADFFDLPPPLGSLVHNFAISASNEKSEFLLLRFLIEQKGLLQAGGKKNLIILNIAPVPALLPGYIPEAFLDILERRGLFTCDPTNGIRSVSLNPVATFLDFEETRQAAFLKKFGIYFKQKLLSQLNHGAKFYSPPDLSTYRRRREIESTHWKERFPEAFAVFSQTIDYLQFKNAEVRVVLMPEGSWERDLPYSQVYRTQITQICAKKKVTVLDWSQKIADNDFYDSLHANIYGQEKLEPAFLDLAESFLLSTHAIPSNFNRDSFDQSRAKITGK